MHARLALALVLIAMATACGGSSNPAPAATPTGSGTTITTANGPGGARLTDSPGNTLYLFTSDTGTSSACAGPCATAWPPFTKNVVTATRLARQALLGTTARDDGSVQVTYAGHPLYLFSGDTSPGALNGAGNEAFGGHWYPVAPNGKPIGAPTATTAP